MMSQPSADEGVQIIEIEVDGPLIKKADAIREARKSAKERGYEAVEFIEARPIPSRWGNPKHPAWRLQFFAVMPPGVSA